MRYILSLSLIISISLTIVSPVLALSMRTATMSPGSESSPSGSESSTQIVYPTGEDFARLKVLIETNFSHSDEQYRYNCISNNTLCPNYKYTGVIEKAIKLIVAKTYSGNESFYERLFTNGISALTLNRSAITTGSSGAFTDEMLKNIISSIPRGTSISNWASLGFGSSIGGELLDASFGLDFSENTNSSTMLGAIESKINEMKRNKCQIVNPFYCSSGEVSNIYLPTSEELSAETIYLNRGSVKIESLKDEIEYNTKRTIETQNISDNSGGVITRYVPVINYTLRYKKNSYTLEEAKVELEKKEVMSEEFLVTGSNQVGQIPCQQYTGYMQRSQCTAARAALRAVITALSAYSLDREVFPEEPSQLTPYLGGKIPLAFVENFSYKTIKNIQGQSDYEIRYIGAIGEDTSASGAIDGKKDYKAMMSGSILPEIPQIFAHIPSDGMVLYVRNPANLLDILNQKSSTSQRLSGIDVSESIRGFVQTFFELEKFDQIEKYLQHDMAIVVNNLDATAPDIVIIISESDKGALSPTAKARVVGSKDGYIFIASSKESLEKILSLEVPKSMATAPDFQYVWLKKSSLVKDALMFVGDEFFSKMLTLETYLTHYRKYRDYTRLSSLQELVWAYGDAFDKTTTDMSQLTELGLTTLTGAALGEYSIIDGLVTHRNIGTLKSVKTLPESAYDLSKISRTELESYKYNILQYRDIWRSSLDPMGIVINRYGDGMEVDFFMTPIPSGLDSEMMGMRQLFEGTTKNTLSFVTNPRIRMGLVSFVLGFDTQRLKTKIRSNETIGSGFASFSEEILGGKNIFDYLGGEFAWSIGGLDPDIFEGWNIEKVDTYISLQVTSEEKGKELIQMLVKKLTGSLGRGGTDMASSVFGMLAKPLIEDYQGKKIYYVEAIPVPWVGNIGVAYTFIDDFFVLGLNRSTIRKVIDTATTGDSYKKNLITPEIFEKGTFFATLFDGVSVSQSLQSMYEKNQKLVPKILGNTFGISSNMTPLASSYYTTQDRYRRLGKVTSTLSYALGSIAVSGTSENLRVTMDPKKLKNLSGSTLEMWESIKKNPIFPQEVLTESGISLEKFLSLNALGDILSVNMIVQLDSAMNASESLLRNVTFGMNMGDDEIGFRLQIWRKMDGAQATSNTTVGSDMWIIGGIGAVLLILGGIVGFVIRRRNISITDVLTSTNSVIPGVDPIRVSTATVVPAPAIEDVIITPSIPSELK